MTMVQHNHIIHNFSDTLSGREARTFFELDYKYSRNSIVLLVDARHRCGGAAGISLLVTVLFLS